ncbi:Aste57867_1145 [Aphanomyces stellatus]|uniref:Aste57867_1145 protein n=1 Tax=Aphanomyces stellatus TaxID=120398 RepID=A0A485K4N2_9STRA|nr:hypothetical protein As57867_001144 [Aphanomyces stellatus]VFT78365.1 Aste57867_1145 [Aphanomyces stellatus]
MGRCGHLRGMALAAVVLATCMHLCDTIVSLPNMEFNAALGQVPYATSYYAFALNPILDTKYVPGNAIDGLVMQTSWWSSGTFNENVYFQVNFTSQSPVISRVVVRWHGYMAARSYEVLTSFSGFDATFTSFNTFKSASTDWDRIDTVYPLMNSTAQFNFLRVQMNSHVACNPNNTVECDSSRRRRLQDGGMQGPIYGIRELEVWAASQTNGAAATVLSTAAAIAALAGWF